MAQGLFGLAHILSTHHTNRKPLLFSYQTGNTKAINIRADKESSAFELLPYVAVSIDSALAQSVRFNFGPPYLDIA
jgi:hypothetical protein